MKYSKYLLLGLCFLVSLQLFGQQHSIEDWIDSRNTQNTHLQDYNLFTIGSSDNLVTADVNVAVDKATILDLNLAGLEWINEEKPQSLLLSIPHGNGETMELELFRSSILDDGFKVSTSQPVSEDEVIEPGLHFWGQVKGQSHAFTAISIFKNNIAGIVSIDGDTFVLGKLKQVDNVYIFYSDKNLKGSMPYDCYTADDDHTYSKKELGGSEKAHPNECVRIYIEVHEDITNDFGSVGAAANYATAIFNQSAILYQNENITEVISEIFVWNSESPYTSSSTSTILSQFQAFRTEWDGDLAQLIGYAGGGGIAAGFNGICNPVRAQSMCYSGINATFQNVPTYSWTVQVFTHELGHLYGSRHTHACVWNGNSTAIDGCADYTEGGCDVPGYPSGGGTIMSYCHWQSVGINFNLGFGPQPGNVIRNSVANGACLTTCCPFDLTITDDVFVLDQHQAENSITALNNIFSGATAQYHAGNIVRLEAGFHSHNGSHSHLYIEGCTGEFEMGGGEHEHLAAIEKPEDIQDGLSKQGTEHNELTVFPNPTNGNITLRLGNLYGRGSNKIQLFDSRGSIILYRENISEPVLELDLNAFPKGVYFLKVLNKVTGDIQTKKVIRQ